MTLTIGQFAETVLNPKSIDDQKTSRSLMAYVRRLVKQFNLNSTDVEEVLNEAFLRAFRKHKNESIEFPKALMRTFCYNVVREMNRGQQKYVTAEDWLEGIPNPEKDDSIIESLNIEKTKKLKHLLKNLSPVDSKIIDFWSQGYSDREITEKLALLEKSMTITNLKKRRQRLIARLQRKVN